MKYLLTSLSFFLFISNTHAQIINNSGTIVIEQGAKLIAKSDITNQSGSSLNISGELIAEGDLTNAGNINTFSASSLLTFQGNTSAIFTTGNKTIRNLLIEKDNADLQLVGDLELTGSLDFSDGVITRILLGDADLTLRPAADIFGTDARKYIMTNGAGYLIKKMSVATDFTFPVGNNNSSTSLRADVSGTGFSGGMVKVNVNNTAAPDLPAGTIDFLDRHWEVVAEGITNYQNEVTATYLSNDVEGIESLIIGASYANGEWSNTDGDRSGQTVSGTITELNAIFTGFNAAALPVELIGFAAQRNGKADVDLRWSTVREENSAHFSVERSVDGRNWEVIGQQTAAGSSSTQQDYFFPDYQLPLSLRESGTVYYRLDMVDLDGSRAYSPLAAVVFGQEEGQLLVYPNPTADFLYLSTSEELAVVSLYDQAGRRVFQGSSQQLDLRTLPAGVYQLRAETENGVMVRRVLKGK